MSDFRVGKRFRDKKASKMLTVEGIPNTYSPHPMQEVVDYMVKKEEIKSVINDLLPRLHVEQVNELHYLITKLQWEVKHREDKH